MRTITRMMPIPPLGKYPQFLLCGHAGKTPTSMSSNMIIIIAPRLIAFSKSDCATCNPAH